MEGDRMDKIVYLYGSARDASTRALRRSSYPRGEMQVRIGPWLIRPARRMAVDTARLLPYAEDLLKKVSAGLIQVQRADSTAISVEAVRAWATPVAPVVAPAAVVAAPVAAPAPEPVVVAAPEEPPAVEKPPAAEPVEAVAEPVVEPEPTPEVEAPAAEADGSRAALLPEDWRQFTAKDLQALCAEHGIPLTKTTKTAAVAAIESWIGGN